MLGQDLESISLNTDTPDRGRRIKAIILLGLMIVLVLGLGGAGYYFFSQYQKTQYLLKNPNEAAKADVTDTIAKVAQLVEVPQGEEPTVATVSDIEKLRDKAFFQTAQNGDKVIVYSQAKKAILFRPSTNKVVEMAPVNVPSPEPAVAGATTGAPTTPASQTTPASTPTSKPVMPARIAVFNGTVVAGLAADLESKLTPNPIDFKVTETGNAVKRNYTNTLIVVINPDFTDNAQKLTQIIGGQIDVLPDGEKTPDADIVVIIGQNYQK